MFRVVLLMLGTLACWATMLSAEQAPASQPGGEQTVIAAVQKLFDAMKAKDAAAIRALGVPGAQLVAVRADGKTSVTSIETFADHIGAAKDELVERMWDPKVQVQGKIATLWAPYDFHLSGKLTHCGIDAVSLLMVGGEWKIAGITYSVEHSGCSSR